MQTTLLFLYYNEKELAIKPKIDLSKFIYEQNDEYEQNSDGNANTPENNVNFNLETDTKLLPKAKHPSLKIKKNNNAKSKTLLKLRKNRGNDIKVQTIINRTYTKENLKIIDRNFSNHMRNCHRSTTMR